MARWPRSEDESTVTRPTFSPELFNARVETQIQSFFDAMANLYGRRGWRVEKPRHDDLRWRTEDFTVEVVERYHDGAYKRIRFTMQNLPGYAQRPASLTSQNAIRFEHIFSFDLPREYPQDIGVIRPTAETPLYHPRLSSSGTGRACYSVRGELDRILEDLPFFVLLKPDRVAPPSQFQSDHGLNTAAMAWYEHDMDNIVSTLDRLWENRHRVIGRREPEPAEERPGGRVRILPAASRSAATQRSRKREPTPASRSRRVRILDDEDADRS
jgi:hypothetical protein